VNYVVCMTVCTLVDLGGNPSIKGTKKTKCIRNNSWNSPIRCEVGFTKPKYDR
jgi:hypothetical protein